MTIVDNIILLTLHLKKKYNNGTATFQRL